MPMTRRRFVKGGVAAFTMGFAAPAFLSDIALAQGRNRRNLVVLYLSGGNDSLSTVIPYTDPQDYARRPTIAIPAANVLQIGTDRGGTPLGLNPRLTGLRSIFNAGRLAIIQRTGYANSSRSHFQGTDIWSTADPASSQGAGWLGRYLDLLPAPVDPLTAWSTVRETPHTLLARTAGVASIPSVPAYAFASPNGGSDAVAAQNSAIRIASHLPVDVPHLAFVNSTAQAAFATLDRVAQVNTYVPTVAYPNNGLAQALRAVAGAMNKGVGTRVFWVQTGGYDTHAGPVAQRRQRHVLDADDDAERFAADVLQRSPEPGAARRHAGASVLRVRPAHHRERQQRHRPRRGQRDDGDGRRGPRRHLRHRPEPAADAPTIRRSRTTAATCATRRTSAPSTRG